MNRFKKFLKGTLVFIFWLAIFSIFVDLAYATGNGFCAIIAVIIAIIMTKIYRPIYRYTHNLIHDWRRSRY